MASCNHSTLELLPERKMRLRCRSCHLTIAADEVRDSYCPECFERGGKKQYEFEELAAEKAVVTYRCLECGIVIKCE